MRTLSFVLLVFGLTLSGALAGAYYMAGDAVMSYGVGAVAFFQLVAMGGVFARPIWPTVSFAGVSTVGWLVVALLGVGTLGAIGCGSNAVACGLTLWRRRKKDD